MDTKVIETGKELNLQYGSNGLLPVIVQEFNSGKILMMAYANQEAFELTLSSGFATFWSRSRNEIWKKGETSGNLMKIRSILVDCDQDCIIYMVDPARGGACHTKNINKNYRQSCFYRKIDLENKGLIFTEE